MGGFIVPGFSIIAAILAGIIVEVIGFTRLAESRTGFIIERKRSFSLFLFFVFLEFFKFVLRHKIMSLAKVAKHAITS
jgi:hypothetical protein